MTTPDPPGTWRAPSAPSAPTTAPPVPAAGATATAGPHPYAAPADPPSGSWYPGPDHRGVAAPPLRVPAGVPGAFDVGSTRPQWHPAAGPAPARGPGALAVAGLVLGACAVALLSVDTWLATGGVSAVALVLAVLGVVLGAVGLAGRRAAAERHALAVVGLTTSAVTAVLAATVLLAFGVGTWPASALGGGVELPVLSLRPGESAPIGDYTVTVDSIDMDADAALEAIRGNRPAEGRYVQAVVTVVYEGTGVGVVEDDLLVSYAGSTDEWLYDEFTCGADTDRPVDAVEPLTPGAQATFTACMDVPVEVIGDTAVVVEDFTAWEFTAETWGVR